MSRKQNNLLRLFYKIQNNIFSIVILAVVCLLFQDSVLAMVSSQQCDKELNQYCPISKYDSAKLRLKCIEEKKKFFTYECVVRILGLPNNNNELNHKAPWLILPEEKKDSELTKVEVDPLKKHNQSNDNVKNTINSLEEENLILKDVMFRTNCLSDMSRLCKMKTRKGVAILKEPLESCINKMIKRESRLTLSCHVSLLNILNKSNKQYTHYNVNGITIHRDDRLKHIDKRLKENHIDSVGK